ncbi:hypothetical protein [Blastococcus sp. TF02-8]|uniref:hypothetical protein n=1 Tax=Blastococcus sp. TF02-8 TaxID=2250574 RepID=UPI0011BF7432|nr:hypothetical protein [Blastococcus sp. TF02-8]
MRLTRLLVGGSVLALLSGTAACGLQTIEPKIQLRDALQAFGDQQSVAVRLSVPSSADDVRAFAEATDESVESEDIADEDLDTLLSSSIVYGYDKGEKADDPADDAVSAQVRIGDLTAGEVRAIGETGYARVDLDGLVEEFPDMAEDVDSFRAELDGAPTDVPEALLAPARALVDGDWVSLDATELLEQIEAMGGGSTPEDDKKLQSDLQELGGKALKDAVVSVERKGEDDDLGDHLVVKLNLRKGYATIREGLPGILPESEDPATLEELPPVSEVPDKDVDASVWVRDGELTRAEFDVAQFLDEPAGHLVLRADALDAEPVKAPKDAVPVDVAALMEGAMAVPPGTEEELDAYTIAAWVDMDLTTVASDEGGEPSVEYLPEVMSYYEGATPDLVITAVGAQVQVSTGGETVCLTPSPDGMGEDIADGPC